VQEKNLYIIAGCNGAGKTTASFTILPEILDCKEFVNADEIAKGLSPFQPEKVAFEAGRIMIERVNHLFKNNESFALETTLASRSYKSKLIWAQENGYTVKLLFFWLPTIEMAIERVAIRVSEGGHNIPSDVIARRYIRGIENLFKIYIPLCNHWAVFDNSNELPILIAEGKMMDVKVERFESWKLFKSNIQ
jgi:predicted ABC-type ATPase